MEVQGMSRNLFQSCKSGKLYEVIMFCSLSSQKESAIFSRSITKEDIFGTPSYNMLHIGMTPLMIACWEGRSNIVDYLLSNHRDHVDINKKKSEGRWLIGFSAIQIAASRGYALIVKSLASSGAHVDYCNALDGKSALHYAASNGKGDVVNVLIEAKANINRRTLDGKSALHLAAEKDHIPVIRALLAHDINIDIRSNEGFTALESAKPESKLFIERHMNRISEQHNRNQHHRSQHNEEKNEIGKTEIEVKMGVNTAHFSRNFNVSSVDFSKLWIAGNKEFGLLYVNDFFFPVDEISYLTLDEHIKQKRSNIVKSLSAQDYQVSSILSNSHFPSQLVFHLEYPGSRSISEINVYQSLHSLSRTSLISDCLQITDPQSLRQKIKEKLYICKIIEEKDEYYLYCKRSNATLGRKTAPKLLKLQVMMNGESAAYVTPHNDDDFSFQLRSPKKEYRIILASNTLASRDDKLRRRNEWLDEINKTLFGKFSHSLSFVSHISHSCDTIFKVEIDHSNQIWLFGRSSQGYVCFEIWEINNDEYIRSCKSRIKLANQTMLVNLPLPSLKFTFPLQQFIDLYDDIEKIIDDKLEIHHAQFDQVLNAMIVSFSYLDFGEMKHALLYISISQPNSLKILSHFPSKIIAYSKTFDHIVNKIPQPALLVFCEDLSIHRLLLEMKSDSIYSSSSNTITLQRTFNRYEYKSYFPMEGSKFGVVTSAIWIHQKHRIWLGFSSGFVLYSSFNIDDRELHFQIPNCNLEQLSDLTELNKNKHSDRVSHILSIGDSAWSFSSSDRSKNKIFIWE